MNLYFLKNTDTGKIELVATARDKVELLKVVNYYLYNMHIVTDYYQRAEYIDNENGFCIIDGYHDDPDKEYESKQYLILERQYSPGRVYDLI